MLFTVFLESNEYLDFFDYLKASRNNKLRYKSSEFDSIYDYYTYLCGSKLLTCKDDARNIYIDFEKQQPIIVDMTDINCISSDNNSDRSDVENKNTLDNISSHQDSDELNEGDEFNDSNKKNKFTLSSVSHPDYPHSSVPVWFRYMRDEMCEKDEEYEEYECNDNNIEIEEISSEFDDSEELD